MLRARVIARGTCAAAAACMLSSGWASASTISTNVTLDDTSSESAAAESIVEGTTYGKITSALAISFSNVTLSVTHGTGATLDTWAGFVLDASSVNGTAFTFTDTTLTGNGNLALAFRSGSGGAHTDTDLSTLKGSDFTGRILLMDQWNNGLKANYTGTQLQNAEIVLAKDGSSHSIGGTDIGVMANRYENALNLTGSATLSGISAEAKGTYSSETVDSSITTSGAGTNTLTLTGGCTTNQTSVFAGNAGASNAYFNLVQQGGSQTFSGTNYFGSVSVTGGTLTLGGTTAVKGDVSVTSGVLNLSGATIDAGKNVALGGGRIDNLTLRVGNTLSQTGSGTLGDLTLSGGTISFAGLDGASYSLTGTLTLGSLTTLDFSNSTSYAEGTTLFSGVSFGSGFTWNEDEWARYFTVTGTEENWKIVYDQANSVFKLAANSAAQLTWDNTAGTGAWNTTDANWVGSSTTFKTGDDVTFSRTFGAVTVDAAGVLASKVTVTNGANFVWMGGSVTGSVNIDGASSLTIDNTVTGAVSLTGASTLTVGAGTLDGSVTFGDAGSKLVLTKTNAFSATATVVGSGIVEVNWRTQTGNVNAQLGSFTGTLQITSGRYSAGNSPLAATEISIAEGGQIYIEGGTWNQTFHLAGTGWTSSDDVAKAGSLRLDNGAEITGEVHLTGDTAINVWLGTGTITTAIDGAGKTLTKVGSGTLKIDSGASAIGSLLINKGTVQLATANTTYGNIGSVTIGDKATLQIGNGFGISFTCADITIDGGGALRMLNANGNGVAIGTDTGTITINASAEEHAYIAGTWGGETNIKSLVTGKGVLELQNGESEGQAYTNPMRFKNTISDEKGGNLALLQTGGQYYLDHANIYTGGTTITGGTMIANADKALGTGDVEVREGGALQANGVTLSNNISVKNAATNEVPVPETRATIAKRGEASGVRYTNARISGTGISSTAAPVPESGFTPKATVSHAEINVGKAYSLDNMTLEDSLVKLQASASVTLTNVAIGSGSAVDNTAGGTATMAGTANSVTMGLADVKVGDSLVYTPSGSETSLTFIGVTTSQLNGVSLTDGTNLTIELMNDLLCSSALVGKQYLAITFEGLTGENALTSGNFTLSDHLMAGFTGAGVLGVEASASGGTVVYIGFAPDVMPEPASSMLAIFGFSGLLLRRRRKS